MPQNKDLEERTEDTTNLTGRHLTPLERRGATPTAQTNQKGFYDNLKRGAKMLILGAGLMGLTTLAGCATTGNYAEDNSQRNFGYDSFDDMKGDYKLVGRNKDIYLEKLDGSESRQITHTPLVKETSAFSAEGNYIIVMENYENQHDRRNPHQKFFLIKRDTDDSTRKEISADEAVHIITGQ